MAHMQSCHTHQKLRLMSSNGCSTSGTRIKAAVVPLCTVRGDINRIKPVVIPTLGWLNEHLPQLVSGDNPSSLVNHKQIKAEYSAIHVAVPGPVSNERYFERHEEVGVPKDLKAAFKNTPHCPSRL
jgi:hypothetical protein